MGTMTFAEVEGIERALEAARKRDAAAREAELKAAQDKLVERARQGVIEYLSRHAGIAAERLDEALTMGEGTFYFFADGTPFLNWVTFRLFERGGAGYEMIEAAAHVNNDGVERVGLYKVPDSSFEQGFETLGQALVCAADQYAARVKEDAEWDEYQARMDETQEAAYQEHLTAQEKERKENEALLAAIKDDPVAMSLLRAFVAVCEGRDVIEVP